MNKTELVEAVAAKTGESKAAAAKSVAAVLESIQGALVGGESVSLVGFGSFSVKEKAARKGRNPQTGAEIKIPARKVPAFKAGKGLTEAVNVKKAKKAAKKK